METNEQPPVHTVFMKGVISGISALVGIVIVGGIVLAYRKPDSTPVVPRILMALHAPAASVNGSFVSWNDIQVDSDALTKILSKNPAGLGMTTDELRTRVLHRLLFSKVAESMVNERGIKITDALMSDVTANVEKALGGREAMAAEIQKQYGWTYDQYRDRVVRATVILNELQKALDADPTISGPVEVQAKNILAEIQSGKDFIEEAKQFSEDTSAADGGDIGFIKKGQTVEPFETSAFALKKGQVSGVVKSEFGYHIIRVDEIKKNAKGEVEEVRVRHILFKTPAASEIVEKRLQQATVHQFIHTNTRAQSGLDSKVANR